MNDLSQTKVLAIDGGGTRCRIAISTEGGTTVVETGSANVSTDFEAATAELNRGLEQVAQRTGCTFDDLAEIPAYLGLAGVTGNEAAQRLVDVLPFHRVRIEDDRPSALRGALGEKDGIVAHCGTGSFLAAQSGGVTRLVGGWGPVLGDEASAQWVGRKALAGTLKVVDGFLPTSSLSDALIAKFGSTAKIVAFAGRASPAEFGSLAVDVTHRAAKGDALARQIMQESADQIYEVCSGLGWTGGTAVCLTGGIGPHFAPYLPAEMQSDLTDPVGEPLTGALSLARDFREEIARERI